jgi:hypothetical protein
VYAGGTHGCREARRWTKLPQAHARGLDHTDTTCVDQKICAQLGGRRRDEMQVPSASANQGAGGFDRYACMLRRDTKARSVFDPRCKLIGVHQKFLFFTRATQADRASLGILRHLKSSHQFSIGRNTDFLHDACAVNINCLRADIQRTAYFFATHAGDDAIENVMFAS